MLKCNIKIYFFLIIICGFKIECYKDSTLAKQANDGSKNTLEIKFRDKDKNKNEQEPNVAKQNIDKQIKKEIVKNLEPQPKDELDPNVDLDESIEEVVKNPCKEESPSSLPTEPNHQETSVWLPKCIVATLHGLSMAPSELNRIKYAIEQNFGKAIKVIQTKSRKGCKSILLSIPAQAKRIVKEIKTTLRNEYPKYSEEALKAIPVFIIGHSQGAEVAMIIGSNHRTELNIAGIVSIGGPLTGTDILENTPADLEEFYEKAKPGLEAIRYPDISLNDAKDVVAKLNNPFWKLVVNSLTKGVRDMRIDSRCSQQIKEFIRENKDHKGNEHNIPILLIAVYISDLSTCFDFEEKDREKVNAFIEALTKVITRHENREHDYLIPVQRHLCRTNSYTNLTTAKDESVYPPNVSIYILKDKLHCINLMALSSGFVAETEKKYEELLKKLSVDAEETQTVIKDFITKNINMCKK